MKINIHVWNHTARAVAQLTERTKESDGARWCKAATAARSALRSSFKENFGVSASFEDIVDTLEVVASGGVTRRHFDKKGMPTDDYVTCPKDLREIVWRRWTEGG